MPEDTKSDIEKLRKDLIEAIRKQLESGKLDNRLRVPEKTESGEKWVLKSFTDPELYLENRLKIERLTTPGMVDAGLLKLIARNIGLKIGSTSSPTGEMVATKLNDIKIGDDKMMITAKVLSASVYNGTGKKGPYRSANLCIDDGSARKNLRFYQNDGNNGIFQLIDEKQLTGKIITASNVHAKEARTGEGYELWIEWGGGIILDEMVDIKVKNTITKIKDISESMTMVSVIGKIVDVKELREFSTGNMKREFKIVDNDGNAIRVVAWGKECASAIPTKGVVKIDYAKVDMDKWRLDKGLPDALNIIINDPSQVTEMKVDASAFPDKPKARPAKSKMLLNAKGGEYVEIVCSFYDLRSEKWNGSTFVPKPPYYFACQKDTDDKEKKCNKSCKQNDDGTFTCNDHLVIQAKDVKKKLIISATIDDGSLQINTTIYSDTAEKIIGRSNDMLISEYEKASKREDGHGKWFLDIGNDLDSKVFKVTGIIKEDAYGEQFSIVDVKEITFDDATKYVLNFINA